MLATPTFHHVHLNSTDPERAVDFYVAQFATSKKATWQGLPAVAAPNDVLLVFSKVDAPPATEPQTALWHFGWHVPDARKSLETYRSRPEVTLRPLYTGDGDGSVEISSDTWPGAGGVLGLTAAQIAEAKATGVQPKRGAGFSYMDGPDGVLVEYSGNHGPERFNHVHLYQNDPFCALLWYQEHLDAQPMEGRGTPADMTEANCKVARGADPTWPSLTREGMYRTPRAGVTFSDVAFMWYPPQRDAPLASPRGHVVDHIGLGVSDLDAWAKKLHGEGVKFLEEPYTVGNARALMIEGPSGEALELVEANA
jgi:catechol 2,3-dioxygenase-like lactoylglutathione lyase family enzyme